ncbi:MAG: hypothetical protein V1644_00660 [Candidatus Micrarchaeota archaeon]
MQLQETVIRGVVFMLLATLLFFIDSTIGWKLTTENGTTYARGLGWFAFAIGLYYLI